MICELNNKALEPRMAVGKHLLCRTKYNTHRYIEGHNVLQTHNTPYTYLILCTDGSLTSSYPLLRTHLLHTQQLGAHLGNLLLSGLRITGDMGGGMGLVNV